MRVWLIGLILVLSACGREQENVALGTLERDRIALTATASEVVVALPVAQGSQVAQGTVLVQLDTTLQSARVTQAKAEVEQAAANLEKLRNGAREEEVAAAQAEVDRFQAELIGSEANFKRIENLSSRNLAAKAERDVLRAQRDAFQANLTGAKEHLRELTNGTRIEDLRMGQANLEAKEAALANAQKQLDDLTIVATRDGTLDNLPWNLGERVSIGSPLAIILAGKAPYARVYVPEPHRIHVKVGQLLPVYVDGLEQAVQGKVRWISNEPAFTPYFALNQEERSRLMYLAEVQLPDSEAALPSGVPAQVVLP